MLEADEKVRELVIFAQWLQIAHESGIPLSQALEGFAENSSGGRHTQWAKTIAQRLSDGVSLRDAVKNIHGMDPLLVSLLSSPSGRSLGGFVSSYIKHLLLLSQWNEKLKTTLLYPVILIWMVVMNLFLINFVVFPVFAAEHAVNGTAPSAFMQILYFTDAGSWPFSLIVPGLIICLAINATYSVFFLQLEQLPFSSFGRMMGFANAAEMEEQGRIQSTIALLLETGLSFEKAAHYADLHCARPGEVTSLQLVGQALTQGESLDRAVELSGALKFLAQSSNAVRDSDRLVKKLVNMAQSNISMAEKRIMQLQPLFEIGTLVFLGILILVLGASMYGGYFQMAVSGG